MKRALLISGGHINNNYMKSYLEGRHYDIVIAIDGGLEKADGLGIMPTHIVGDFDTVSKEILNKYSRNDKINIKRLIPEKDFTDTQVALSTALDNGCTHIEIAGGTGTRLDHTIANIHILQMALGRCEDAVIVNENNRIRLVNGKRTVKKTDVFGKYISFLPLTEHVKNVSLRGFKYPLDNYDFDVKTTLSLGVSNELAKDEAEVEVDEGVLIMIESAD